MKMKKLNFALIFALSLAFLSSCNEDDETTTPLVEVPSTYSFTRNGESSVSYSGQTARLDMLAEMKSYLGNGNNGEEISSQTLLDMFANENSPFADTELSSSGKQLESKTFATDITFFKAQILAAATASVDVAANQTVADQGKSGLLERGTSGKFVLVSEKGWEYQQIIEKGLMGAVFLHQIYNVYLTDSKTGDAVDNITIAEGKNYTAMEHHWDEAFGYWGAPESLSASLPDENDRFWAKYTYGREAYLGTATGLIGGFLTGRTAIVNNNTVEREAAKMSIYSNFELAAAGTALHYINEAIVNINDGDLGNLMHSLSEGYAFVMALKYSPNKSITQSDIDAILNTHFGTDGDFWTVTVSSLNDAKNLLVNTYSELGPVADEI
jgi:hypothetical protein